VAYLLAYVVGSLAAFAVVVRVARTSPEGPGHRLTAYAGLWRRDPVTALVLGFALLCLAGLPPGVMGLVAKVIALVPVVGARAWGLAAVAVLNAVLGIAVYLRWAAHLAGGPSRVHAAARSSAGTSGSTAAQPGGPPDGAEVPPSGHGVPPDGPVLHPRTQRLALALAAAGCLALSVLPEGLIALLGDSGRP
jgi:NADH-quinone oxidoreductase subunit N